MMDVAALWSNPRLASLSVTALGVLVRCHSFALSTGSGDLVALAVVRAFCTAREERAALKELTAHVDLGDGPSALIEMVTPTVLRLMPIVASAKKLPQAEVSVAKSGAERQREARERRKASRGVTKTVTENVTRNVTRNVTSNEDRHEQRDESVMERHEQRDGLARGYLVPGSKENFTLNLESNSKDLEAIAGADKSVPPPESHANSSVTKNVTRHVTERDENRDASRDETVTRYAYEDARLAKTTRQITALQKHYSEAIHAASGVRPSLMSPSHAHKIASWCDQTTSDLGIGFDEVARELLSGFVEHSGAAKKKWPTGWLASSPHEYWRRANSGTRSNPAEVGKMVFDDFQEAGQ